LSDLDDPVTDPVTIPNIEYWTRAMEKQVGARIDIVMGNPLLLSVYQKFGAGVFRRSSVFHGLERILRDNAVRGKCAFEIGTWNGLTAVILSQFFDEVITVDIAHNAAKHAILQHLGITNVRCVDISENAEKAMALKGIKIDFAYLDGNHAEDTESDFDLVRRCGRVLFHECWPFQSPVWELVRSLPYHQVVYSGAGLALWDKFRPGPEPLEPRNG